MGDCKTKSKTLVGIITCMIAVFLLTSCGGPAGKAPMEEFTVADKAYKVKRVIELPDQSSEDQTAYGVEVLMQDQSAPMTFSGMPGGTMSTPKSMIDIKLFDGDTTYTTSNIQFKLSGNDSFKGLATFIFKIPKDADFPKSGEFFYTGDPEESVALDFTDIKIEIDETAPAEEPATDGV